MSRDRIVVSLVVATVGRDLPLQRLLHSLKSIDPALVEILIVDQNADDRVTRLLATSDLPARHVRVPWANASRARNLGAELARGRWVAFPDDDCWAEPDTISGLLAAIAHAEGVGARVVTGPILDERGDRHMRRWPAESRGFTIADIRDCAIEATTVFRCEDFLAVGGFDPRFGPGGRFHAAEGDELLVRLDRAQSGWLGWCDPGFAFGHPRTVAGADRAAVGRTWRYALGAGAAWGRHPRSVLARTTSYAVVESIGALLLRRPHPWLVADRSARALGILVGVLLGLVTFHRPRERREGRRLRELHREDVLAQQDRSRGRECHGPRS